MYSDIKSSCDFEKSELFLTSTWEALGKKKIWLIVRRLTGNDKLLKTTGEHCFSLAYFLFLSQVC